MTMQCWIRSFSSPRCPKGGRPESWPFTARTRWSGSCMRKRGSSLAFPQGLYMPTEVWATFCLRIPCIKRMHSALRWKRCLCLEGLGSTTRHNFRYYRRRFEASGHRFIARLSMEELRSVALDLFPKSKFTAQRQPMNIQSDLNMVAAASQPLAIGLRHRGGEWLSVIGGWYRPGGAVLCFQCNNEGDFGPDSLSVVLRAYLIELLILQGREELVIWGDTGPPLSRYVSDVPTIGVRLDVPTYWWRAARLFVSRVGPRLPRRLAAAAQWISCGIFATFANY